MNEPVTHRIVVGVDGSECSKQALRWALAEAELRGSTVELVHAWHLPHVGLPGLTPPYPKEPYETAARELIKKAVADLPADAANLITRRIIEGPASSVLVDAAIGAELLVVGSHGRGEFAGMLLGSVSHHCAQHAPCPLVIVRRCA